MTGTFLDVFKIRVENLGWITSYLEFKCHVSESMCTGIIDMTDFTNIHLDIRRDFIRPGVWQLS